MVEIGISKQMSRILSRFDKNLNTSPTCPGSIDPFTFAPNSKSNFLRSSTPELQQDQSKSDLNLKDLYHESIGRFLKQPSPRAYTPDLTLPLNQEQRSKTPTLSKNSTQILRKSSNFQPKLNKNSLRIAARLGDPQERLVTSSSKFIEAPDELFTFHPEINKRSKKLADVSGIYTKNRWEALYAHGEEKKKQNEQMKALLDLKETEKTHSECLFKPQVLTPSVNSNPSHTVDRLNKWAKGRELRLKEKKDSEIDKDLKECTFTPKIKEFQQSRENLTEIKGISPYIQRGKKLQIEKPLESTFGPTSKSKDIDKKKYESLLKALHDELQSLEL